MPHSPANPRLRADSLTTPLTEPSTYVLALARDDSLTTAERFALDLLIDLSAVLRADAAETATMLHVRGVADAESANALRARGWGITTDDDAVLVERALLHFVVELAGAAAEQRTTTVDRFDRVPASASMAVRQDIAREPVVSIAARALGDAVRRVAGRRPALFIEPWPDGRRWAAALSHDLDVVQWWPAFTALRMLELARRLEGRRMVSVVGSALRQAASPVVWSAAREVLATEARHGVRSTWFVLCGSPTLATARAGDLTYLPESPAARRIIDAVRNAGHEIGLHGSFATSTEADEFVRQRERLARLAGREPQGVRQHYLRLRPASTPAGMAAAGFRYDSTSGFADRNGFRLGVADVVPMWHSAVGAPLEMDEAPFTWMDRALSKYQGVEDPMVWIDDALALAERCRDVGGLWVGIWHPNLAPALGFPGAPAAYDRLVRELVAHEPFIAPIGDIVAWRAARRAVRATAIAPDGTVHLAPRSERSPYAIRLRDADGREQPSRMDA